MSVINAALQKKFLDLIDAETGIQIRSQDWGTLALNIINRTEALALADAEAYYHLLAGRSELQRQEWDSFLNFVTIGESYFFRDQDQFEVLRSHLLPDLIAQQRLAHAKGLIPRLSLSLWSAGCSTGEEPYSLAILLQELLPDFAQWHISIVGTDLNPAALNKARQGIYRDWSFRQTDSQLRSRCFQPVPAGWQIQDSIRARVTFRGLNLLTDPFPNGSLKNLNLIVCRNVFIYFETATIAHILKKLQATLDPNGYLVTGHAELYDQNLQSFDVLSYPGSMAYRPRSVEGILSIPKTASIPKIACTLDSRTIATVPSSISPHRPKPLASSVETETLQTAVSLDSTGLATQYLLAQTHWQQGDLEQAMHHCQAALQLDGEARSPLYLMAQIAGQRDRKQAKNILKKILYLQPNFIPAYLNLADIYADEGQPHRATKMYRTAQDLLKDLPRETWIDYRGRITAGELLTQLSRRLLQVF
ncbi:MAG: CheR family methyltransferase [Thermosynechococcaceae cyanobacterium]